MSWKAIRRSHAAAMTTGSTIEARNSDAVLHTTHLYGPAEINISLPIEGASSSRTLDEPGIATPTAHVYLEDKLPWVWLDDELNRYKTLADD